MTRASDLSTRVAGTIRDQNLFKAGDTLIVGLSGGADSTALLDLLTNLPGTPLHLVAAHLNHCLRGVESDADEDFCRALAEKYKVPFESRRVEVKVMADERSLNLEDAGRRARITFFDTLLAARQAHAVVLAHHADDQAETVLMRLLRGSGATGLAGMPYQNSRGYVRPLLDITRAEIEAYLLARGIAWREDSSNRDTAFLRNRIRHELLPLLEQYNPSIRRGLATTASLLSAENDLLMEQSYRVVEQTSRPAAHGSECSVKLLVTHPLALQRRAIRLILSRLHDSLDHFNHQHVESVCRMAASNRPNARISLPQGTVVTREYDTLAFQIRPASQPHAHESEISGPGCYLVAENISLTVEHSSRPVSFEALNAATVYFDLDKVPFPWHVRTFVPGDRMQQLGMVGKKKLKDIFIDCKTPPSRRSTTPLIFSGDDLIWVCGLRSSQVARLDEHSTNICKVVFSRSD